MTLRELITALEIELSNHGDHNVAFGFGNPHSYRGYYQDLGFEPVANTTVSAMLAAAKSALGATFTGYKGDFFTMNDWTDCWIAWWGNCGEGLGPYLLEFMLGRTPSATAAE